LGEDQSGKGIGQSSGEQRSQTTAQGLRSGSQKNGSRSESTVGETQGSEEVE